MIDLASLLRARVIRIMIVGGPSLGLRASFDSQLVRETIP